MKNEPSYLNNHLFSLLTSEEILKIKKTKEIRNVLLRDLTLEEIILLQEIFDVPFTNDVLTVLIMRFLNIA